MLIEMRTSLNNRNHQLRAMMVASVTMPLLSLVATVSIAGERQNTSSSGEATAGFRCQNLAQFP